MSALSIKSELRKNISANVFGVAEGVVRVVELLCLGYGRADEGALEESKSAFAEKRRILGTPQKPHEVTGALLLVGAEG